MREIQYIVKDMEKGRTVKSIALKEMRLSRGLLSSLKFQNGLLLDGAPVHADARVLPGQVLSACLKDPASALTPAHADIRLRYCDEDYLILEKPAPLPTLCSAHQTGPTVENSLYALLDCPADYVFRPVNRLDKGTSGLMAAARNAHAQQLLQKQLHTDSFVREYEAVCRGIPAKTEGVIDLPIGKADDGCRRTVCPEGRPAVTHYRVLRSGNGYSHLRLRLETGRTHQIRVHLNAIGCPIAGDYLYGQEDPLLPGRFALHACFLSFRHPLTGETLAFESPMPKALYSLFSLKGNQT